MTTHQRYTRWTVEQRDRQTLFWQYNGR